MKKFLLIAVALLMAFLLVGCDSKSASDLKTENADGSIIVLDAKITTEVRGDDGEQIVSSSQVPAGHVFADLTLYIDNNTSSAMDGSVITGGVQYDGDVYSVVYGLENEYSTGVNGDALEAGKSGVVHIFASIPDSALETTKEILAWATIDGVDYGMKVNPISYAEPINQKSELNVGDSVDVCGGKIQLQVLDCDISNYISATKDETYVSQTMTSGATINLTVKITNNTLNEISDIYSYVMSSNELTRATIRKENSSNTSFATFNESSPLKSGESAIFHIYADYSKSDDSKLRVNVIGKAFYIKG